MEKTVYRIISTILIMLMIIPAFSPEMINAGASNALLDLSSGTGNTLKTNAIEVQGSEAMRIIDGGARPEKFATDMPVWFVLDLGRNAEIHEVGVGAASYQNILNFDVYATNDDELYDEYEFTVALWDFLGNWNGDASSAALDELYDGIDYRYVTVVINNVAFEEWGNFSLYGISVNGKAAAVPVTNVSDITNIPLYNLMIGDFISPVANVIPTTADNKTLHWSSLNENVLQYDELNHKFQALGAGKSMIRATSDEDGEIYNEIQVSVSSQPVILATAYTDGSTSNGANEIILDLGEPQDRFRISNERILGWYGVPILTGSDSDTGPWEPLDYESYVAGGNYYEYVISEVNATVTPFQYVRMTFGDWYNCKNVKVVDIDMLTFDDGEFIYSVLPGTEDEVEIKKYIEEDNQNDPIEEIDKAVQIPEIVNFDNTDFIITAIAPRAFSERNDISEIEITESITEIGAFAFQGMENLSIMSVTSPIGAVGNGQNVNGGMENYTVPNNITVIGDYAFFGCKKLKTINLEKIVTIGRSAFANCTALENITIGESAVEVSKYAFYNCISLKKAEFLKANTVISDNALCGALNVTIHGFEVSTAKDYYENNKSTTKFFRIFGVGEVFKKSNGITYRIISKTAVQVGNGEDSLQPDISSKTSVTVNETVSNANVTYTVTKVGDKAFQNCTNLQYVNLPDSMLVIGNYAFDGCNNLFRTTLFNTNTYPTKVTGIGNYAYRGCSKLTNLTFTDELRTIGNNAFENCTAFSSVVINYKLTVTTSIGNNAFKGCASLTTATIPVVTVGNNAFKGCTKLNSIDLPMTLRTVGDRAFENCSSLPSITIPYMASIGDDVFIGCTGLMNIYVNSTNPYYSVDDIGENNNYILYDKNKTTIIQCASGRSVNKYYIPETVTTIRDNAFRDCGSRLQIIVIPNKNMTIGANSFMQNQNITFYAPAGGNVQSYASSKNISFSPMGNAGDTFTDNGINYKIIATGKVQITGIVGNPSPIIYSVPKWADNQKYQVTSIGTGAFNTISATQINLPDSISEISENAFNNSNLVNITVDPANIYYGSHQGVLYKKKNNELNALIRYPLNKSDNDYVIPEGVEEIRPDAARGNTKVKSIDIASTVWGIWPNAFYGCTNLEYVDLKKFSYFHNGYPKNKEQFIESGAFDGCVKLVSITLPDTMVYVSPYAFSGCNALTEIIVEDREYNQIPNLPVFYPGYGNYRINYFSIDGVLFYRDYNKEDRITLVRYPHAKTGTDYTVPTGTQVIVVHAFAGNNKLQSILFPNTIKEIEAYAFTNCSALTSINLPYQSSGVKIGSYAFYQSSNLEDVYIDINNADAGIYTVGSFAFSSIKSNAKLHLKPSAINFGNTGAKWNGLTIINDL